jgi:hypothetical protein
MLPQDRVPRLSEATVWQTKLDSVFQVAGPVFFIFGRQRSEVAGGGPFNLVVRTGGPKRAGLSRFSYLAKRWRALGELFN